MSTDKTQKSSKYGHLQLSTSGPEECALTVSGCFTLFTKHNPNLQIQLLYCCNLFLSPHFLNTCKPNLFNPTFASYTCLPVILTLSVVPNQGSALLRSPYHNKGSAYPPNEREEFQLYGLLPPNVQTLEEQVTRAYEQYSSRGNALAKNTFMTSMKEQNEVLYYKVGRFAFSFNVVASIFWFYVRLSFSLHLILESKCSNEGRLLHFLLFFLARFFLSLVEGFV